MRLSLFFFVILALLIPGSTAHTQLRKLSRHQHGHGHGHGHKHQGQLQPGIDDGMNAGAGDAYTSALQSCMSSWNTFIAKTPDMKDRDAFFVSQNAAAAAASPELGALLKAQPQPQPSKSSTTSAMNEPDTAALGAWVGKLNTVLSKINSKEEAAKMAQAKKYLDNIKQQKNLDWKAEVDKALHGVVFSFGELYSVAYALLRSILSGSVSGFESAHASVWLGWVSNVKVADLNIANAHKIIQVQVEANSQAFVNQIITAIKSSKQWQEHKILNTLPIIGKEDKKMTPIEEKVYTGRPGEALAAGPGFATLGACLRNGALRNKAVTTWHGRVAVHTPVRYIEAGATPINVQIGHVESCEHHRADYDIIHLWGAYSCACTGMSLPNPDNIPNTYILNMLMKLWHNRGHNPGFMQSGLASGNTFPLLPNSRRYIELRYGRGWIREGDGAGVGHSWSELLHTTETTAYGDSGGPLTAGNEVYGFLRGMMFTTNWDTGVVYREDVYTPVWNVVTPPGYSIC